MNLRLIQQVELIARLWKHGDIFRYGVLIS